MSTSSYVGSIASVAIMDLIALNRINDLTASSLSSIKVSLVFHTSTLFDAFDESLWVA